MEVLVAGGTGYVGSHLCPALVERGHDVVALAREPEAGKLPDGVETRRGDVTTYDGLQTVIEGKDAVINLVALSPLFQPKGGEGMQHQVHVQGTRNLVRAMEAEGVDRLIQLSGIGADPDAPTEHLKAKGRAEGIVRASDLDWTIFRPGVLFGDGGEFVSFTKLVTTPYVTGLPGGGKTPFQPIWISDGVEIIADALEAERHIGQTYEIGGPEVLTLADVTRAIYAAEGRSVRILPIPMPLAGIGLTIAGRLPLIPFSRDQYRSLKLEHTVEQNDIEAFDRTEDDLLRFERYLEDVWRAGEARTG